MVGEDMLWHLTPCLGRGELVRNLVPVTLLLRYLPLHHITKTIDYASLEIPKWSIGQLGQ